MSSQGMDKKCDNSKGEAAKKQAAADGSAPPYDFSAHLITGSPTEVSLQHPLFTHSLVVNTSAVSALASRGRLLGSLGRLGLALALSVEPLPMVALRGA